MEKVVPKNMKITFMSGDSDEKTYNEYYATMPWEGEGFATSKKRYGELMSKFGLKGIPCLMILKGDGSSEEAAE